MWSKQYMVFGTRSFKLSVNFLSYTLGLIWWLMYLYLLGHFIRDWRAKNLSLKPTQLYLVSLNFSIKTSLPCLPLSYLKISPYQRIMYLPLRPARPLCSHQVLWPMYLRICFYFNLFKYYNEFVLFFKKRAHAMV